MHPEQQQQLAQIKQATGLRISLRDYEQILQTVTSPELIMVKIETYEVKELAREDRYNKKGLRLVSLIRASTGWQLDSDQTLWDSDFQPFVYEKSSRRQTAAELTDQREWEKLCYRPGRGRFPLDSYERVTDPWIRSTDKMERHF